MVGILDYINSPQAGILSMPDGAFPPAGDDPTKRQKDAEAAWAAIEAANAKANADADRRNAAGLGASANVAAPNFGLPGPDASSPAVTSALGNMPTSPFGSLAPIVAQPGPTVSPDVPQQASAPIAVPAIPLPRPRPTAAPAAAPKTETADDAALPPNATLTEGQGGPASPAVPETSLLGRIGKGLQAADSAIAPHTATLLALAGGLAGAPSWGTGLSRGFTGAAAALPVDQKLANQNATVQALVKRGMPSDLAAAAAGNPAILQQILPQVFGAKQRKFTQIGEDTMGNKQFGFVDEASGKAYDMTGKEIDHPGAGTTVPSGPDGNPLTGPALMAHLEKTDPVTAAGIKGLISGDLNAQGRNLQKLAPLAKLVDPTFDATQYPVRLKTRESYTSGKDFQETQALNTVGGHLGKLMDSADKLGNTNVPIINKILNAGADTFTGSPALVKFRNDLVTTSNELAKAYHGGHVSDSAYAAFNKAVNESQTPAELKAAIGELSGLLQSKIEAKESGYRSSMANAPLPDEYRAINDEAKHSFARINDWANGTAKPQQAAGAQQSSAPVPAVKVNSVADAAKLPKGTHFIDPNGIERIVP